MTSVRILGVFDRALVAGKPLPIAWLRDSLKAGRAMPVPGAKA